MSERERWVVYPLLFLALGASLRDKLGGRTTTKSIVCQELRIEDEPIGNQAPRPLAVIGRTEATAGAPAVGFLAVNGEVAVTGAVKVDGVMSARKYEGGSLIQALDVLRALQALQNRQSPDRSPLKRSTEKPAAANAEKGSAPAKSNSDGAARPPN
jgi:hypothetical protein